MSDASIDTDAIDFFRGSETVADPYPYFDRLRAQCPVHREPQHGVYMVTGYEEAFAVYADPDTFSSCNSVTGPFPGFPVALEGRDDVSALIEEHRDELPFSDQIITMDPPKHRDHRHLLMRQLTPKRLKENEDFVWRLADRQIDSFITRGRCELIGDYANQFTLFVIADLLGVPEEDHDEFRNALARQPGNNAVGSTKSEMSHNPLAWLYDRFGRYIEDRRQAARRRPDRARHHEVPERRSARGDRRRPGRRQRLRGRAGDNRAAPGHRAATHGRPPGAAAAPPGTTRTDPGLRGGDAPARGPGEG